MTWVQFSEMFHMIYAPLVEWERLAYEYLDMRQGTKSVTEITMMFTKRDLFCPEFLFQSKLR